MTNAIVLAGSTIRVTNTFYNFEKTPTDPNLVKFKVYDISYKLIVEKVLGSGNRLSEGKYFVDYQVSSQPSKRYILEFYGEIAGNPTFERKLIQTVFMR